jgi:hypothetical protein
MVLTSPQHKNHRESDASKSDTRRLACWYGLSYARLSCPYLTLSCCCPEPGTIGRQTPFMRGSRAPGISIASLRISNCWVPMEGHFWAWPHELHRQADREFTSIPSLHTMYQASVTFLMPRGKGRESGSMLYMKPPPCAAHPK